MADTGKTKGVLLLAFGGAESLEDVEPFLKNILKGRPVTPEMVEKARERYRKIGGGSPLLEITRAQAAALESRLNEGGRDNYRVYVGMRFWHPYIKEAVREMWGDGIEEAVAIVMAPHSSRAATGGYLYDLDAALKTTAGVPEMSFPEDWHTHPAYIDAVAEKMEEAIEEFPEKPKKEGLLVIFSAHSLPLSMLKGDPYLKKLEGTIEELIKQVPLPYRLAYQSKSGGPVEWLGPEVEEVIAKAKGEGRKGVLVVPLSFVSDHVETLYDIDVVFKEAAEACGLSFFRSGSLNTSPRFIELLAGLVETHPRVKNPA
ncbi:MAG: ferrochelatase [Thermodesulfobacteriota bacterium]